MSNPEIDFLKHEGGYYFYQVDGDVVKMIYPCGKQMSKIWTRSA